MVHYSPLLNDQYQLVMAYSYWKIGMAEKQAVFYLSFRKLPADCAYILAAGLERIIEFIQNFQFTEDDLNFLEQLQGQQGFLFPKEFLTYLKNLKITCDIDAVPEGTLLFAKEPVLRIKGPILQCQLLETPLLNFINFASLIATKASKAYLAAEGDPLIEFGLRRAQGPDGGLTASRSAFLGGCTGTSNVLAGKLFDIPLYGTQAHSWIMAFPTEMEAFKSFADTMKGNTSLLVDTYDTLIGIRHAIKIGQALKKEGKQLVAIRLDSGNLLELSQSARQQLDSAGLHETKIMASGDLDENLIRELKKNNAPINAWGIGTKLVTSYNEPALNAIYKLSALENQGLWENKMKITSDLTKLTLPGILQVQRLSRNNTPIEDIIFNEQEEQPQTFKEGESQLLLEPILKQGELVYSLPTLNEIRQRALQAVTNFVQHAEKPYPVAISQQLQTTISALIQKIKSNNFGE
jgi:nicotinate phosphoribosyltransferase